MPVYEYVCQSCGAEVEVLHGLNDPGPGACDVCGGPMRKRLAPPAIVFRGSGWAKKERREAVSARSGDKAAKSEGKEASTERSGDGADAGKSDGDGSKKSTDKGASSPSSSKEASAG